MKYYNIASIPGDGIGNEVVPAAIKILEKSGTQHGFCLSFDHLPWSCDYYRREGVMMPKDGLEILRSYDAIFLGAVGDPSVPDPVSLWGLLIPIRRHFRQYVNLRPVRLLPGVRSPLADRKPEEIDFIVVRENNEGHCPGLPKLFVYPQELKGTKTL